jgi:hypothetical protein
MRPVYHEYGRRLPVLREVCRVAEEQIYNPMMAGKRLRFAQGVGVEVESHLDLVSSVEVVLEN